MKVKSYLAMSLLFFTFNVMANADACLDNKIKEHRKEVGDEAAIHYAMIEEWEEQCKGGGTTSQITHSSINVSQGTGRAVYGSSKFIIIQSQENLITINRMIVNRGNCAVMGKYFPKRLSFGQAEKVFITPSCNVLEVEVTVDNQKLSYRFGNN